MSWFGDPQWLALVTLFVAAVVTLLLYLFQNVLGGWWRSRRGKTGAGGEEDSLISWLLSLSSWRSQWLKAWIAALNEEAGKRGGSLRLAFEEDSGAQLPELSVKKVSSLVKSENAKVVSCCLQGDCIQFAVRVTRTLPANSGCQVYSVRVTPLLLNMELQVKEGNGREAQAAWTMASFTELDLQVQPKSKLESPGALTVMETLEDIIKNLMSCVRPVVHLSTKPTDGRDYQSPIICPPKPPRAHELKLQVRNIKASLSGASEDPSALVACSIQLDNPVQKFTTAAVKQTVSPAWEEEFILELNAKSKELLLQIWEAGKPEGGAPLTSALVPLDLFRKNPSGRQSFPLSPAAGSATSGSISAQFLFVEPNEVKSYAVPVPVPAKKVEMDRTVMPCGTVVTTITSVTSKPRLDSKSSSASFSEKPSDSPARTPPKIKVIEKEISVQAIPTLSGGSGGVSKALSSSDTELLMLNGSDPVAEAAIRQLRESSRQSLKSPRKKSTIIISGISKSLLTADDEATLMLDYAATMDSATRTTPQFTISDITSETTLPMTSTATLPVGSTMDDLQDSWDQSSQAGDWTSNGLEGPDSEAVSVSNLSVSETGSVRKPKGGLFHKGAKLFFRRRHQQKDPSMSQSHNDLVYLEHPASREPRKRGATLSRLLNKKLLPKSKHKTKPGGTAEEEEE